MLNKDNFFYASLFLHLVLGFLLARSLASQVWGGKIEELTGLPVVPVIDTSLLKTYPSQFFTKVWLESEDGKDLGTFYVERQQVQQLLATNTGDPNSRRATVRMRFERNLLGHPMYASMTVVEPGWIRTPK